MLRSDSKLTKQGSKNTKGIKKKGSGRKINQQLLNPAAPHAPASASNRVLEKHNFYFEINHT
jgi:hypothetical protein